MNILSVDAWRDDGGWVWNQWFNAGSIEKEEFEKLTTNRKILKYFRDNGYTSEFSVGRASVEDDGYNIVICERSNGMPLFAIEYGNHYY